MHLRHTLDGVDELGAWRVFLSVSERGSFTLGAAAAGVPQPVASRRVAALEARLGERLLDRSGRRVTLTPLGRTVLPSARRLVQLAESIERDASRARTAPFRLVMPTTCSVVSLAHLAAAGRAAGLPLDVDQAEPLERAERVRNREAGAAIVAVSPEEAVWSVALGCAVAPRDDDGSPPGDGPPVFLDALRPGRGATLSSRRRLWVQPEDDVPHVRDRLFRARDAAGLAPTHVLVAPTLTAAVGDVLSSTDLLVCSPEQAATLGLRWHPFGDVFVRRSYGISSAVGDDVPRMVEAVGDRIADCLGATRGGAA